MIHIGTTYPSRARLEWGRRPLLLEPLIAAFPGPRMMVAHLGHPWEEEDVNALNRRSPNVFTDISALHFHPWPFWQALVTALEYGVTHRLLLGRTLLRLRPDKP